MLLLLFLCCNTRLLAQWQVWRHIPTSGLNNPNITCITGDKLGFVYVGTQEGVNMFDGQNFRFLSIRQPQGKKISPFVEAMRWNSDGNLWVITRSDLYVYDPRTGVSEVVPLGIPHEVIKGAVLDTARQALYLWTGEGILSFNTRGSHVTPRAKYLNPHINQLCLTDRGEVYALADNTHILLVQETTAKVIYSHPLASDIVYLPEKNALAMLAGKSLTLISLPDYTASLLPVKNIPDTASLKSRITVAPGSRLLIEHFAGLSLLNSLNDTQLIHYAANPANKFGLRTNFVYWSYIDEVGNTWTAEDNLDLAVLPASRKHLQFLSAEELGGTQVWSSYYDEKRGVLLTGTELGLCFTHPQKGILRRHVKPPSFKGDFTVTDISVWNNDELALCTNGSGLWLYNLASNSFKPFEPLYSIFRNKSFWGIQQISPGRHLLYSSDGLFEFRPDLNKVSEVIKPQHRAPGNYSEIINTNILKIRKTRNGDIWLATAAGITVMDSLLQVRKRYDIKKDETVSMIAMDIADAPDGHVYVATMGQGAYKIANGQLSQIHLATSSVNIYNVAIADSVHLLFTTSNGLCLYNTRTGNSAVLAPDNGLPVKDFNQNALYYDGKMFMAGGDNGVIWIEAKELQSLFTDTASLHVLQDTKLVSALTLPQGNTGLDVDVSLTAATGASCRLVYKMDGLDNDWQQLQGNSWHIRYSTLPPGKYLLQIKAIDNMGVLHISPATLTVNALPFFWQTALFRVLAALVCLTFIVLVVRFFSRLSLKWKLKKLEEEQRLSRERIRISRELHDNVGSQLTYLITGLESSEMLLRKNETAMLDKKIGLMQVSARESIQQLRDAIWALNTEHLDVPALAARMENWLNKLMTGFPHVSAAVDRQVAGSYVLDPVTSLNLFRIVQEAVHNVVKHAQATSINLGIYSTGSRLTISIKDNGGGFTAGGRQDGHGMRSMKTRAAEINAEIEVSTSSTGTNITVTLELQNRPNGG